MKLYDSIEYKPANSKDTDLFSGESAPLKMLKICKVSQVEDMKTLDLETIRKKHLFGSAGVGVSQTRGGEMTSTLSYAGIEGIEEFEGTTVAVVEGVVTIPTARYFGIGTKNVNTLLAMASTERALAEYGYEGFLARCNDKSQSFFRGLGFVAVGNEESKHVMLKPI